MFNTNAQCYQKKSQVLLTSAFILWPTCTRGFGIREKIRCGLRFFGVFLCGFAVFGPPYAPFIVPQALNNNMSHIESLCCQKSLGRIAICSGSFSNPYNTISGVPNDDVSFFKSRY